MQLIIASISEITDYKHLLLVFLAKPLNCADQILCKI